MGFIVIMRVHNIHWLQSSHYPLCLSLLPGGSPPSQRPLTFLCLFLKSRFYMWDKKDWILVFLSLVYFCLTWQPLALSSSLWVDTCNIVFIHSSLASCSQIGCVLWPLWMVHQSLWVWAYLYGMLTYFQACTQEWYGFTFFRGGKIY